MDDLELSSSVAFHDGWTYLPSVGHVIRRKQSAAGRAVRRCKKKILRGFCGFHHHQISGVTFGP